MIGDLFFVDKKYVDGKSFVSARQVNEPFQATPSDLEILKDTSVYRVFEINGNLSSARSSYFHKSLGGYHAAKPRRIQELFDYQIARNNIAVLNMLNVKYIIQTDEKGQEFPVQNPDANGNAWFVQELKIVNSADAEMKALDKLDSKNVAVLDSKDAKGKIGLAKFEKDTTAASILLKKYKPNDLTYVSNNTKPGFAVFSENYYENGWNAYIDGKLTPHNRVNYVLRGMYVPAGKHTIVFKFEPEIVKTGSTIALFSSIGMLLLIGGGIYTERKNKQPIV